MNLLRPDVYVQDRPSSVQTISTTANMVGAMVGTTRSGKVGEAVLVSSFTEFTEKFANGLDTPYMSNSMLPYAVLGFFQNGGNQLNIVRCVSASAKTATTSEATIEATANNPGSWANKLKIQISKNVDYKEVYDEVEEDDLDDKGVTEIKQVLNTELSYLAYDVTVSIGDSDSFTLTDFLTKEEMQDALKENYKFKAWLDSENFAFKDTFTLGEKTITFAGGVDGVDDLTDSKIQSYFSALDAVDDIMLMAVPGHTTKILDKYIMDFCDSRKIHPILDFPKGTTVDEAKMYRRSISANGGAIYYPWLVINDPLTDSLKTVPTCGHVMGLYSYFNDLRGIGKAPAGTTAIVRGAVDLEYALKGTDLDILNPIGVCCIQARTNTGIVVWGARSLNSSDSKMKYVTDILINYFFHSAIYKGTQFAVFEPNDQFLWKRVDATIRAFLTAQWNNGVLKGSTTDEAFVVVCDETINTQETIDEGILYTDVAYAPNKPAEFIVIRLAHDMQATD